MFARLLSEPPPLDSLTACVFADTVDRLGAIVVEVLVVDDEPLLLEALSRKLRRSPVTLITATSPVDALEIVANHEEFPVVVADLRMPRMDGIEFFQELAARTPDTTRVLLTGQTEQEAAARAINEGRVFRFLTKPCSTETFLQAINDGVEEHQRIKDDRELNQRLVSGITGALVEVLEQLNPVAMRRATRLRKLCWQIAFDCMVDQAWEVELIGLLTQIGQIFVPPEVTETAIQGKPMGPDGIESYQRYPERGAALLARIPRLDTLAEAVRLHQQRFDGAGANGPPIAGERIPLAARVVKIATDLDDLIQRGQPRAEALASLQHRDGTYDPQILRSFSDAEQLRNGRERGSAQDQLSA